LTLKEWLKMFLGIKKAVIAASEEDLEIDKDEEI